MVVQAAGAVRPDEIRRHNLSLLLAQVHRDGALTRAELTQRLELSRSTVGALVGDLAQLGLVEEVVPSGGPGASTGVGRPSYLVGPHRSGPYAAAVDVDVEHTTIATVGIGGEVRSRHEVPTPEVADPVRFVREVSRAIAQMSSGGWLCGVGVSVPGTVDPQSLRVGIAPNLGWHDVALGDLLAAEVPDVPLAIGNDADLAVLAEHQRGSARGRDHVVYLMVRIGLGAGIITGGVPLRGQGGNAGEIGHNVLDPSGPPCHCGKRGCAETFIGDGALLRLAGHRGVVTDAAVDDVYAGAVAGKERDRRAVCEVAEHVGHVIGNLVNTVDPQRVIVGGSLTRLLDVARPELDAAIDRYAFDAAGRALELCAPGLGDDSALLGAAEAALQGLLADPLKTTAP